jgi:hypothetical protein
MLEISIVFTFDVRVDLLAVELNDQGYPGPVHGLAMVVYCTKKKPIQKTICVAVIGTVALVSI